MSSEIEIVNGSKRVTIVETSFPVWAARGWQRAEPVAAVEDPAQDPAPAAMPETLHATDALDAESDVTAPRQSIEDVSSVPGSGQE